jgi:hypothetical protein
VRTEGSGQRPPQLGAGDLVARLERAEDELGFSVRSPGARTRLVLALTLRHLR